MSLFVDIKKKLGNFTLEVQLDAADDVIGMLGASGSGKSMTLRCIAGIVTPDSGEIVLDGKTLYSAKCGINLAPRQRGVGLMFQNYALFPHMTVAQNIAAGVRRKEDRPARIDDYMRLLRLEGLGGRYPSQLSGGQQQRVALARMLASAPGILLLDEPFSALDRHLRFSIEQEFSDALRRFHGTVLMVSHNVGEVYQYCSQAVVLVNGAVAEHGAVEHIFHAPATLEGARLTGCKNISEAACGQDGLFAQDWNVRFAMPQNMPRDICAVGVRETDLVLTAGAAGGFAVTVRRVKQFPQFAVLDLVADGARTPIFFSCPKADVPHYLAHSGRGELRLHISPEHLLPLRHRLDG